MNNHERDLQFKLEDESHVSIPKLTIKPVGKKSTRSVKAWQQRLWASLRDWKKRIGNQGKSETEYQPRHLKSK